MYEYEDDFMKDIATLTPYELFLKMNELEDDVKVEEIELIPPPEEPKKIPLKNLEISLTPDEERERVNLVSKLKSSMKDGLEVSYSTKKMSEIIKNSDDTIINLDEVPKKENLDSVSEKIKSQKDLKDEESVYAPLVRDSISDPESIANLFQLADLKPTEPDNLTPDPSKDIIRESMLKNEIRLRKNERTDIDTVSIGGKIVIDEINDVGLTRLNVDNSFSAYKWEHGEFNKIDFNPEDYEEDEIEEGIVVDLIEVDDNRSIPYFADVISNIHLGYNLPNNAIMDYRINLDREVGRTGVGYFDERHILTITNPTNHEVGNDEEVNKSEETNVGINVNPTEDNLSTDPEGIDDIVNDFSNDVIMVNPIPEITLNILPTEELEIMSSADAYISSLVQDYTNEFDNEDNPQDDDDISQDDEDDAKDELDFSISYPDLIEDNKLLKNMTGESVENKVFLRQINGPLLKSPEDFERDGNSNDETLRDVMLNSILLDNNNHLDDELDIILTSNSNLEDEGGNTKTEDIIISDINGQANNQNDIDYFINNVDDEVEIY